MVFLVLVILFRFARFGCFGGFVSVALLVLFQSFRWFRSFCFAGFVSLFRVLVHAVRAHLKFWNILANVESIDSERKLFLARAGKEQ